MKCSNDTLEREEYTNLNTVYVNVSAYLPTYKKTAGEMGPSQTWERFFQNEVSCDSQRNVLGKYILLKKKRKQWK